MILADSANPDCCTTKDGRTISSSSITNGTNSLEMKVVATQHKIVFAFTRGIFVESKEIILLLARIDSVRLATCVELPLCDHVHREQPVERSGRDQTVEGVQHVLVAVSTQLSAPNALDGISWHSVET